jgi:hypothetical protein
MSGELIVGIVSIGASAVVAVAATVIGRRTALRAVEESRRARVDAAAPRVVVRSVRPKWPPVTSGPAAGTVTDLNYRHAFDLPGDAHSPIMVICHMELVNEGASSAFVTLPPGCIPVENREADPAVGTAEWRALAERKPYPLVLAPGDRQLIRAGFGQTVAEWTTALADTPEGTRVSVSLVVRDQFSEGIGDDVTVSVSAKVLEQSPQNPNTWHPVLPMGVEPPVTGHVEPTVRTYRRST